MDHQKECQCFGDSGAHASTHVPSWTDRECCDLCGWPVKADTITVLEAVNSATA